MSDQARVLKLQLEDRIGRKVLETEPVMPELLRLASMYIPRFQRGTDGLAPNQRQACRFCELEVVPFGETV